MSVGGTDLQTVLATFLPGYLESRVLHPRQRQVCAHIGTCRTPALGGQRLRCESEQCDYQIPRYHSCRDRHCPKCQGRASAWWCERQRARVLPAPYYHLVFTLPERLNPWVQAEPALVYHQLFQSAWATLKAFARNPKHLGGEPGMTGVLHTWGQTLIQHVHLHCLVPGGALSAQGTWRSANASYLFPSRALSRRFRGHFVSALRRRAQAGELERVGACADIDAMLDTLMAKDWVVYAKPIAPGLSAADHARAADSGPPFVEAECGYAELLEKTGWKIIDRIDVSVAYEDTGRRHIREVEARADQMSELLGEAEFGELLAKRHRNVEAVADRIVRRDLFVASPFGAD